MGFKMLYYFRAGLCSSRPNSLALKGQMRCRYTRERGFKGLRSAHVFTFHFTLYKMRLSLMHYRVFRSVWILSQ